MRFGELGGLFITVLVIFGFSNAFNFYASSAQVMHSQIIDIELAYKTESINQTEYDELIQLNDELYNTRIEHFKNYLTGMFVFSIFYVIIIFLASNYYDPKTKRR